MAKMNKEGRRNTYRDGSRRPRNKASENTKNSHGVYGATARDKAEGKAPGLGQYERKIGDRVFDPSVHPVAFFVTADLGVRPASES